MEKDIRILHQKITEFARYFDTFCRENGIVYYLMAGSALGAVRHKGFIPWDDDFDVFMTYDNYMRFLDIASVKLDKEHYYLQREDTKEWPNFFSKVRMNNTTFIEEGLRHREMHHGIFIDVMCLNNTSSWIFSRRFQYLCARLLSTKALVITGYRTKSKLKKFSLFLTNVLVNKVTKKLLLRIVRGKNSKKTKLVGHFFGRAKFAYTSFPVEYLGIPRYVPFENIMLPVPQEVEKYLAARYGERYMEPPSQAVKDMYGIHAAIWDVDVDYRSYQKRADDNQE